MLVDVSGPECWYSHTYTDTEVYTWMSQVLKEGILILTQLKRQISVSEETDLSTFLPFFPSS